jgi:hypothetical protein
MSEISKINLVLFSWKEKNLWLSLQNRIELKKSKIIKCYFYTHWTSCVRVHHFDVICENRNTKTMSEQK